MFILDKASTSCKRRRRGDRVVTALVECSLNLFHGPMRRCFGFAAAIIAIAVLTFLSGAVVAVAMREGDANASARDRNDGQQEPQGKPRLR